MTSAYVSRIGSAPEEGIKAPVETVTVGDNALFGLQTYQVNDRVLARDQTVPAENGIYIVKPEEWERAPDMNRPDDVTSGQLVVAADTGNIYQVSVTGDWTPGFTAITFPPLTFASTLDELSDVSAATPVDRNVLVYDGLVDNQWEARALTEADISDLQAYLTDAPSDGNTYGRLNGAWAVASAIPAGLDTQIQYNNGGAFGGMAEWTYNSATGVLTGTDTLRILDVSDEPILIENATAGSENYIKWYLPNNGSGSRRWRMGLNNFSAWGVWTSNDADNSHQALIQAQTGSATEIIGTSIFGNSITFFNGGGTPTLIDMSNHNLRVGSIVQRAITTGALQITGGDEVGFGAKIILYGQLGSQANDMYFESGQNNRWMQWDESAGQLRIRTKSGTKLEALDLNNDQSARFYGTAIMPAATTSLEPLRIPHGTAPTTPTDGSFWSTTAGFFGQVNGSTVGPFIDSSSAGIGGTIADNQIAVGAATADTIEGSSSLTWSGTILDLDGALDLGTGANAARFSENLGQLTINIQNGAGIEFTDGNTANTQRFYFDIDTGDFQMDGNLDLAYISNYAGTPANGNILEWNSGNTRAEFSNGRTNTFTPTLTGSTTNPTQSYLTQFGEYVRIGRMVTVFVNITMASSGISGGTGNAEISGLPFTADGGSTAAVISGNWGTTNVGGPSVARVVTNGTSVATLYAYDNDAGNVAGHSICNAADVTNLTTVVFTMTYFTDDA